MKTLKKIPNFENQEQEAEFWKTHDTADYIDWTHAKKASFPNLKPTTESISLRLPMPLLTRIKELANEQDVPYQSLMKIYLSDRVKSELRSETADSIALKTTAKFEIYESKNGYRWRLKAANGDVVATGEEYDTKAGAKRGIESVKLGVRKEQKNRTL